MTPLTLTRLVAYSFSILLDPTGISIIYIYQWYGISISLQGTWDPCISRTPDSAILSHPVPPRSASFRQGVSDFGASNCQQQLPPWHSWRTPHQTPPGRLIHQPPKFAASSPTWCPWKTSWSPMASSQFEVVSKLPQSTWCQRLARGPKQCGGVGGSCMIMWMMMVMMLMLMLMLMMMMMRRRMRMRMMVMMMMRRRMRMKTLRTMMLRMIMLRKMRWRGMMLRGWCCGRWGGWCGGRCCWGWRWGWWW